MNETTLQNELSEETHAALSEAVMERAAELSEARSRPIRDARKPTADRTIVTDFWSADTLGDAMPAACRGDFGIPTTCQLRGSIASSAAMPSSLPHDWTL